MGTKQNMRLWMPLAAMLSSVAGAQLAVGQCEVWQGVGGGVVGSTDSSVYAVATYNGDLIVAGGFEQAGVQGVNRIARFNGSNWFALGGGVTGGAAPKVLALAVYNGELIAGGDFTLANGPSTTVNRIARWNGSFWQSLGTLPNVGMNAPVRALAVFNGELIAGGDFSTAGGQAVGFVARWNGTSWQTMGGFNGPVTCFTVFNNELYAGGSFTTPAARIARWNGFAWQAVPAGGFNNTVTALTVYNGELYAGGLFTQANGQPNGNFVVSWTATEGWEPPFGGGTNNPVFALTVHNNKLIVGGSFTHAGPQPIGFGIASWNASTGWQHVGGGVNNGGDVLTLALHNGDLIAGGRFVIAGGISASRIARFWGHKWLNASSGQFNNGANWSLMAPPGTPCSATFGDVPSANPYTVTFPPVNLTNSACVITNQKPTFDLGGFQYNTGPLTIGTAQPASLTVTDGTLAATTTALGPFGTLTVNNGLMTSTSMTISSGGVLSVTNGATLTVAAPTMMVSQSTMFGDGTFGGHLFNSGTLRPGNLPSGGATLTLNGNYTQQPLGVFDAQLDTAAHGRLTVNGNAAVSGLLRVSLIPGANPPNNQFLPILSTAGSLNGTFSAAILPFLGPDKAVGVQYVSGAAENGRDGIVGGGSGIVIVIGTPNGSPDFGDSETFTLEGEPTGISGAVIGELPPGSGRDLALSVAAPSPNDPGNALILLNQGDGTAFDPVVVPVGREPSGIVSADLADNNGDNDLAVPNKGDDNVSILLHDGGEDFTVVNIAVGNSPSAIAAAELNGDAFIDLAVTNQLDNTVTLLFNNGDRTFSAQPTISVGAGPSAIAAAEVDGEPGVDIIVANAVGGTVTVFRNLGGGGFGNPTTHPTGVTPSSVDPADLDNDKDVDLVAGCSGGGTVSLILNQGNGNFDAAVNLPVDGNPALTSGALTHWDMDADDDIDLVVVVDDDQLGPVIRILRNDSDLQNGQIAFTLFDPIGAGEEPRLVRGADVTGDLAEDLVAVNVQQLPLAGPPSSSLSIRPNLVPPAQPGDVNGDGHVNIQDLLRVVGAWGPCPPPCDADVFPHPTGNGQVNIEDLLFVIANWG